MPEKTILAIDLGTSSMKVALVDIQGRVLGWESEPISLFVTPDGGVEQSPQEWWQVFLRVARNLVRKNPEAARRVVAVCSSTQGEGTIAVDRNGQPLGNCLLWMDMRGAVNLRSQLHGAVHMHDVNVFDIMHFVHLTGGMPSMTGKDPAGHMLFIRDTQPEVYQCTFKFLNVLDFINLRLTGRFTATVDSILTSWVTDNRSPGNIHYDDKLIHMLGLDREKLPDIVACAEVLGPLRNEVADELGLSRDVQVVAGSIDNTAAAVGAGAVADYALHLYIGTSSWMAAHVPYKKTDILSSLASVPCALPDRYLLTALQATAGGNLTFLRDNILYHKDELLQEAAVPDIFKVLDQIAERPPAGSNGVIYTPWIWGERAPVEDRTLRAGLYNLSLNNNREDVIRAFLEGIAFNTRWLLNPVQKFMKRKVECMNIVGGGAQSDVWCQIFADILNFDIRQVQNPVCANACGAAWIGSVGMGEIDFPGVENLVKFKRIYTPDKANRGVYDDHFAIFQNIYKNMNGLYRHLNS
jgi:xylulokinase